MEKARILIVEDEAIIAMELESQLQSLGYEVTSIVDTGVKAIEKAEADKPELIIMDIRIKGGMDGIDTAEVIRNRFGIPVIFLTSYADEENINRAKLSIPYGYLIKPVQERDLRITIEMALYVAKINAEREKLINELQGALEQVKQLKGLIPICANCKKIRDDKGYWNQIESYIEKHSEALFSHSVCPECAEELYKDTKWYKKRKAAGTLPNTQINEKDQII
ncbi:response regulator [bacterium]|nr:response regulator [bacterium]